ncbi:M48 family metallopeptidase, partial [Thermincola ferriacetica]
MSIEIHEIILSKRKTIALVVTADAKLVVRAPLNTPTDYIKSLVQKKKKWITEKQQAIVLRNEIHKEKQFVNGEGFLYLGDSYKLEISKDEQQVILKHGRLILPETELRTAGEKIRRWYKNEAKRVIQERVKYYSQLTGIKYKSVKITDAKRRWGSCGPKGSLNFTWRLVMAPLRVIDYVVVHELAHIEFADHSKEYWVRVRTIMPDF